MDDPDIWIWIWLVFSVALGIGEILAAGSFFLGPFAVGGLAAFLTAIFGGSLVVQWVIFLVVSLGSFAALRPLARRLDASMPSEGIGANYLIGAQARVLDPIPHHGLGLVQVDRQEWRAESLDGARLDTGTLVRVVEVRGTRVVVVPVELSPGIDPTDRTDDTGPPDDTDLDLPPDP